MTRPRGPKATRSRPALQFAVWRLVREEIAYRGAVNVLQACHAIIERVGTIQIEIPDVDSVPIRKRIAHAPTLHQWYAAAEVERCRSGSELAALCARWEVRAKATWRDRAGAVAAAESLQESERAGLLQSLQLAKESDLAGAAADSARRAAGAMPTPRKNRR